MHNYYTSEKPESHLVGEHLMELYVLAGGPNQKPRAEVDALASRDRTPYMQSAAGREQDLPIQDDRRRRPPPRSFHSLACMIAADSHAHACVDMRATTAS
jgi:hypothetical protein